MDEVSYNHLLKRIEHIASRTALLISSAETGIGEAFVNNITPEEILRNNFGYNDFRPLQKEIIQNVLDRRDTLAVLPTGGGKSLCYQIPSLIFEGMTIVVSPLISLMQDQVSQLEKNGISAVHLNSSLDYSGYLENRNKILEGKVKLLYLSPEALNTQKVQELLSEAGNIECITIDEAHCISSWGHDFRPDYMEIKNLRSRFPKAVFLALTATATKEVRQDIISTLKMQDPAVLVSSFNRENIFLNVMKKREPVKQVRDFLLKHKGQSGIIYCLSRKAVDALYEELKLSKFNVTRYHAGLTDEERSRNQELFISDRIQIIVCTLAFGMGINKPNVRFVIHYDLPKSVEQYYQEIGRAGRDGLESEALLLYKQSDAERIRFIIRNSEEGLNNREERLLTKMLEFAESNQCRRKTLLSYFGEAYEGKPFAGQLRNCCDICSYGPSEAKDVTVPAQKFMSCILRTKERYGARYIIDVLRGSSREIISERGHDLLSTYGIGKDLNVSEWMEISNELIKEGYIGKTEDYAVLYVTRKGHMALNSRESILLQVEMRDAKPKDTKQISRFMVNDKEGERIVKELREWRLAKSKELNAPPFTIFADRTMFEIAQTKPHTITRLLNCHGIGEQKAERFGEAILNIVNGCTTGT